MSIVDLIPQKYAGPEAGQDQEQLWAVCKQKDNSTIPWRK